MDVSSQVFTLCGVALGALASFLVSYAAERTRYQRDRYSRWEERKYDAFANYISDVKEQTIIAIRIGASRGLNDRITDPLSPEEGMEKLAEITSRRSLSSERAALLADADTLTAIRSLNDAAWLLYRYACGVIAGASPEEWATAFQQYNHSLNEFHRCARAELGTPGQFVDRPYYHPGASPSPDGNFEIPNS